MMGWMGVMLDVGRCARLHIGWIKQMVHHNYANMMISI